MRTCPNSGISVPECSCRVCLTAQLEQHMPSLLARREAKLAHSQEQAALTPPSEQQRRAA